MDAFPGSFKQISQKLKTIKTTCFIDSPITAKKLEICVRIMQTIGTWCTAMKSVYASILLCFLVFLVTLSSTASLGVWPGRDEGTSVSGIGLSVCWLSAMTRCVYSTSYTTQLEYWFVFVKKCFTFLQDLFWLVVGVIINRGQFWLCPKMWGGRGKNWFLNP